MVRPGLRRTAAGLTTLVVLLAGCGGDDGGDVQAYCDISRELDAQETAIETGDPVGAFDNAEVEQRLEPIEAFEARECDSGEGQEEE